MRKTDFLLQFAALCFLFGNQTQAQTDAGAQPIPDVATLLQWDQCRNIYLRRSRHNAALTSTWRRQKTLEFPRRHTKISLFI